MTQGLQGFVAGKNGGGGVCVCVCVCEGERNLMGSVGKNGAVNRATKDERSNLYVTFV